jgi:hypothetical protein
VDERRRRLLVALGGALILATLTWLLVRDDDVGPNVVAEGTSTTTQRATTTTRRPATTTTTAPPPPPTTVAPATTAATVPPPATTTTRPPPPFQSSVQTVTAEQLGASWRPEGCPAVDTLRALDVSHWGYDGAVRTGRIIVHRDHADRIVAVFRDLYAARFPIERMVPIDAYGGDDQASMRANNTSGFNCRTVAGSTTLSQHAYGLAIDVNPLVNPYVKGSTVDPPEGAPYADRSRNDQGMIHANDAVVQAFARQGWAWGGYWTGGKDYQHFSANGR